MEEKKFDVNSLIGFLLLGAIMVWYMYTNQPTPEELEKQRTEFVKDSIQKANQQQVTQPNTKVVDSTTITTVNPQDSVALSNAQSQLGAFAYSATLPSAKDNETTIENDLLKIRQKKERIAKFSLLFITQY